MFWKGKKTGPEIFSHETNDQRLSVRIRPPHDEPITFEFDGKKVRVIDISAGGLSFEDVDFVQGDSCPVNFDLPRMRKKISALVEIITIDNHNICHCRFKDIQTKAVEEIHQYILMRQKEVLRLKRGKEEKLPLARSKSSG